jgi:hypothetical protein
MFFADLQRNIDNIPMIAQMVTKSIEENRQTKITQKTLDDMGKHLKDTAKVSDDTVKNVIDLTNSRYGNSNWGFMNSITEVAQDFTLERRLELEQYASSFLRVA